MSEQPKQNTALLHQKCQLVILFEQGHVNVIYTGDRLSEISDMAGNDYSTCSQDLNSMVHCQCDLSQESDLFCANHSQIICEACRSIKHMDCHIESIGSKSSKFKSKTLKSTMKMTVDLNAKVDAIKHSGKSRLHDLKGMKDRCKVEIKSFRQELERMLDKLEIETLKNLDCLFIKQNELLELHISSLTTLCDELDNGYKILQDAKKDGRKEIMFVSEKRVSKNLQRCETACENIETDINSAILKFEARDKLSTIRNMRNLGIIFTNENQLHQRTGSLNSDDRSDSFTGSFSDNVEGQQTNERKQSQMSGDHIRLMKEQLQRELERQAREAQENMLKIQSEQVHENKKRKDKLRQDTIQQEQERLELIQRQKQDSESERNRKEQMRLDQLRKELDRQDEIRERIEQERKSRQGLIQEMLLNTTQQEKNRQELIRQQQLRTEQSRKEQMKEQERLAQIRQTNQEELNEKQMRQKAQRQEQIQREIQRQKEVQEKQQQTRQEYLRQTHDEQMKHERQRQEKLQQERIRREKIKYEKIQEQQREEEMRREREELIRQEKAQKEALRQEQLRQEQMKIEQLQEQQRQMREEQIRQLKEDQIRQSELLKSLYKNIK